VRRGAGELAAAVGVAVAASPWIHSATSLLSMSSTSVGQLPSIYRLRNDVAVDLVAVVELSVSARTNGVRIAARPEQIQPLSHNRMPLASSSVWRLPARGNGQRGRLTSVCILSRHRRGRIKIYMGSVL